MDIVRFTSPLKPDGKRYRNVVYWNRFMRTKIETLILLLLFVVGCILVVTMATREFILVVAGALGIIFPILVITQLNSSIRYHLENRDRLESLPCDYTVMSNGILVEISSEEYSKLYKWEDSTDVYDKLDFYMFFNKNDMTVMIDKTAVSDKEQAVLRKIIRKGMGKKCHF